MGSGTVDVHTKFHEDWFRRSKVNWGGGVVTETDIIGSALACIHLFQIKEGRLKSSELAVALYEAGYSTLSSGTTTAPGCLHGLMLRYRDRFTCISLWPL
jgi:hypothetical protein